MSPVLHLSALGSMRGREGMVHLLPSWVRWIWLGIFAFILVPHATHPLRTRGVARLWHSLHLLMAVGMTYMFLPLESDAVLRRAWELVFVGVTVFVGGCAVWKLFTRTRIDLPWVTLTVDLGIMAYMLAMMDGHGWAPLSYGAAFWCASEAVAWFTGELSGRHEDQWLPKAIGLHGGDHRAAQALRSVAGAKSIAHEVSWLSRTTLGLMSLGMAYMLVTMQVVL